MDTSLDVVIASAGGEEEFKSKRPKLSHKILGMPLWAYPLRIAKKLSPRRTIVFGLKDVLPHGDVLSIEGNVDELRKAVAAPRFLLLPADLPLIPARALEHLFREHIRRKAFLSALTVIADDPGDRPRLLRDESGIPRDMAPGEAAPGNGEAVSGVYLLENTPPVWEALERALAGPIDDPFCTLIPSLYPRVHAVPWPEPEDLIRVRTRGDLARVEWLLRQRIVRRLQEAGVTVVDPATAYIGPDVKVETDTVLHPGVYLYGRTEIGEGCEIGPQAYLVDSTLGRGAVVWFSVLEGAYVGEGARIGPYAHLRPGARIGRGARIGNFVEVKNAEIGEGVRAGHLAYIGDAEVGSGANIGAGTITCNFDGVKKHRTVIGKGAFIGSNAALVAPVTVGEGAIVGAGSVITEDVPPYALALGRARQVTKPNWVRKKEGRGK